MLRSEIIENGERVHHWSDEGCYIRQIETGILYEDAVDNFPCRYTYEETDELIETDESEGVESEDQEN